MTILVPRWPQRMRGRQTAFALSVLASVALNALALGAVTGRVGQWRPGAIAQTHDGDVVRVVLTASPPLQVEPGDAPLGEPAGAPPTSNPSKPREHSQPKPRAFEPIREEPVPKQDGSTSSVRFYAFDEVDEAALPNSDWNLDTGVLDEAGVIRLVFEAYISSRGEVVDCRILEPATLAQAARTTLEERLRSASLRPAQRGGIAVASFRRIELSMVDLSP